MYTLEIKVTKLYSDHKVTCMIYALCTLKYEKWFAFVRVIATIFFIKVSLIFHFFLLIS